MSIAQSLITELDHELAVTRKVLERVPESRFPWKPHAKSMSLHDLAGHTAGILGWGGMTLATTELDLSAPFTPPRFESTAHVLAELDRNGASYRAALVKATDADLGVPWTLKAGAQVFFSQPRAGVLRGFVMNHLIHHRGQLSVYLRLLDVPVPSIYGPSADDNPMGVGKHAS
ncbi:MAG: DinB family protein [Planctomycetes bacterium]|nr:DinB family protein [Planctomycetota bacterium]